MGTSCSERLVGNLGKATSRSLSPLNTLAPRVKLELLYTDGKTFPAFPYQPYDIQQSLMESMYATLETGGVGLFESPTGCTYGSRRLTLLPSKSFSKFPQELARL